MPRPLSASLAPALAILVFAAALCKVAAPSDASPAREARKGSAAVQQQTNKVDQKINAAQRSVDKATAQVDSTNSAVDAAGGMVDEAKRSVSTTGNSVKHLKDSIFGVLPHKSNGGAAPQGSELSHLAQVASDASTDTVIVSRGGPLHYDALVERWLERHGQTASDMVGQEGESQIFGPAVARKPGETTKAYKARCEKQQAALTKQLEDPAELERQVVVTRLPVKLGAYDAGAHRVRVLVTTVGDGFDYPDYVSLDDNRYAQLVAGGACMEIAPRLGALEGFACIPEKQAADWQKLAQLPAADERHLYAEVGLSLAAGSLAAPARYKERVAAGAGAGMLYARPTVQVFSCSIKSGSQILARLRPVAIESGFEPSADAEGGTDSGPSK